ncbi:MAG TPA: MFS transporter, partial [Bryobacteraceae bacterium]|nr:MFS transporter [Bryobacteraceae bacterium]
NVALAQALGLIIASVSVGPLIDSRGKRTALLLGLSLAVVALFLLPSSGGYRATMALMFLLGLGGGIIVTGANALAGDVNETQRASTLNLLNVFFGLGGLLTPLIAARLLSGNAVALCYMVAGLTGFTLLVHVATSMPAPSGERGFKFSEVGCVLGSLPLYLLALFLFLYVACEVGVWNWLAKHLIAQGVAESEALTILSLGFALGLLVGRVVVARILRSIAAPNVTLAAAVLMTATTYLALQTSDPSVAWVTVFCAGVAMAPVFPTTLAMTADAFPRAKATAMGIVITSGWVGLAVSSKIVGAIAGGDDARLKTALLVLPGFSLLMVLVSLIMRPVLGRVRQGA